MTETAPTVNLGMTGVHALDEEGDPGSGGGGRAAGPHGGADRG
jgi:hypothetical protein